LKTLMHDDSRANLRKPFQLPDEIRVSQVQLRTATLARSLEFYQRVIGLKSWQRGPSQASLSATEGGPSLLVIAEDPNAAPRPRRATGLYHFAIRYPVRGDLADALRRITAAEYPISGAADHGVAESIHLNDADGNGVELYCDRPRSRWPMRQGRLQNVTRPLDLASLLAAVGGGPIPAGTPMQTDIGHINLHVADLIEAEEFFHNFLGLEVMARVGDSATFLATGGYHHHVAVNTWAGKTPAPQNAVGLISYRLEVPDGQILAELLKRADLFGYEARMDGDILQVRDPNGCWLELTAGEALQSV
jgi:catechol 2,3-dioxygenase